MVVSSSPWGRWATNMRAWRANSPAQQRATYLKTRAPEMHLVQCYAASVRGDEEWLAVAPGDGFGPHLLDLFDDLGRHRHIVEFLGHLAAVSVCPSEELKRCRCRCSVRRLFGNEDEGRRSHRPGRSTRLISEDDTIARHRIPVGIGGRSLERFAGRRNDLAVLVHHPGVDQLVL